MLVLLSILQIEFNVPSSLACIYCTVTLTIVVWEMAPECAVTIIEAVPRLVCPFVVYPPQETRMVASATTESALTVSFSNAA